MMPVVYRAEKEARRAAEREQRRLQQEAEHRRILDVQQRLREAEFLIIWTKSSFKLKKKTTGSGFDFLEPPNNDLTLHNTNQTETIFYRNPDPDPTLH